MKTEKNQLPQAEKQTDNKGKFKNFFKKIGTRNLVIICAVLLIGTAVGINYILYNSPAEPSSPVDVDMSNKDFNETLNNDSNASNYFSQTVLSRKQARDESLEILQTVAKSDTALPEAVESALNDIAKIAKDIDSESKIETLVKAKGFDECIAVINDNKATVIVKTDGLLVSQVAQINEIVYEQSGILPSGLTIIEKK